MIAVKSLYKEVNVLSVKKLFEKTADTFIIKNNLKKSQFAIIVTQDVNEVTLLPLKYINHLHNHLFIR